MHQRVREQRLPMYLRIRMEFVLLHGEPQEASIAVPSWHTIHPLDTASLDATTICSRSLDSRKLKVQLQRKRSKPAIDREDCRFATRVQALRRHHPPETVPAQLLAVD